MIYYNQICLFINKYICTPRGDGVGMNSKKKFGIFGEDSQFPIGQNGKVERRIKATSDDGRLTLTIPRDTVTKDRAGERLEKLKIDINENPPPPPKDAHIIGLAYKFRPSGANFDPPITIGFTYDPDAIPEGVDEEDLALAYYDNDDDEWIELEGTVDPDTHTITASVSHFTTFAIVGNEEEEILPEPAAFTSNSPATSPTDVNVAEEVELSTPPSPPLPPSPSPQSGSINRQLIGGIIGGITSAIVALVAIKQRQRI